MEPKSDSMIVKDNMLVKRLTEITHNLSLIKGKHHANLRDYLRPITTVIIILFTKELAESIPAFFTTKKVLTTIKMTESIRKILCFFVVRRSLM